MTKEYEKPEIKPVPAPRVPSPSPEIVPKPDKNRPEHPLPEITPHTHPEIQPVKKNSKEILS